MKRILTILITLLFVVMLAACGADNPVIENAPVADNTTTAVTENAEVLNEDEKEITDAKDIIFEEIVVVDNDACTIKITGIEEDNIWGYSLKAFFENKTADQTLMFSVTSAAINDVMADPFFASEVAPSKKSNETISFMGDDFNSNDIGEFTDILLNFRVYDSEDWMADPVAECSTHIYPYGEDQAVSYNRETIEGDTILVDTDDVTVILTDCDPDTMWGYAANLYIVNKTDTTIMVSADNVSVNGFMIDPFYGDSVDSGKRAFSAMSWYTSDLEDNGITEVESIELTLRVYDENDWSRSDFVNEVITITP